MYYVTTTARRKNAKRHIADKVNDLETARKTMDRINNKLYIIEVYNGKWELIERRVNPNEK